MLESHLLEMLSDSHCTHRLPSQSNRIWCARRMQAQSTWPFHQCELVNSCAVLLTMLQNVELGTLSVEVSKTGLLSYYRLCHNESFSVIEKKEVRFKVCKGICCRSHYPQSPWAAGASFLRILLYSNEIHMVGSQRIFYILIMMCS